MPVIPDHELLACIGRGSYGEVWLAKSVTGAYRAVKIVFRDRFPDDRPYEREFRGIQKFEPVSRTHESQVDILHVGRNEAEGFFYYVMELADDAGAESPESKVQSPKSAAGFLEGQSLLTSALTYVPRTLKLELSRQGQLPLDQCVEIGLALCTALEHLHSNGLVHRDVKPSNIIFVNGAPKLADIGLVADVDGTVSFVGTEGYIPPEGPGSPQADLYSLGKVLYEICTGKDRQDFPEPATVWEDSPEQENLRELHEIVLKACEPDPRKRYQTAREMRAELALLLSGKSVKRLRMLERRVALLIKVAVFTGGLLAVVAGICVLLVFKSRADREHQRAEGIVHLLKTQTARLEHRAGARFDSLVALSNVAAIRPSLEMRNEAIACMILPDARVNREWDENGIMLTFDDNLQRYAIGDTNGNITVRRMDSREELASFPGPGMPCYVLEMSPDGRFVAAVYHPTGKDHPNFFYLWSVEQRKTVLDLPGGIYECSVDFSRDSRWMAVAQYQGPIRIYEVPTLQEHQIQASVLQPATVRFSPKADLLAIAPRGKALVEIKDLVTWKTTATLQHPKDVGDLDWHPNGKLLAAGCDDFHIYLWDTARTQMVDVLKGHTGALANVGFNHGGDLLMSRAWDQTTRFWNPHTKQTPVTLSGVKGRGHFSVDDHYFGAAIGGRKPAVFEIASGREHRALGEHVHAGLASASFGGDGRLLATLARDGVRLWSLPNCDEVGFLPVRDGLSVMFHPNSKDLLLSGPGLQRWTMLREPNGKRVRFGSEPTQQFWKKDKLERACLSADGHLVAVCDRDSGVRVYDLERSAEPLKLKHEGVTYASYSADGKWLATSLHSGGAGVKIWDVRNGELSHTVPVEGSVNVAFSPDGRWLVTASAQEYLFWEVGSWRPLHPVRRSPGLQTAGWLCFNSDGSMLAISRQRLGVQLIDPNTGAELATLSSGTEFPLCFSPDGNLLVTGDEGGIVYLWDLKLVRRQLGAMHLDWELASAGK